MKRKIDLLSIENAVIPVRVLYNRIITKWRIKLIGRYETTIKYGVLTFF
jgi:hypothetical protein